MPAQIRQLQRGESTNCVSVLEDMLSDAKAGKILAVAVVAIDAKGGVTRCHGADASDAGVIHLMGGVHLLLRFLEDKAISRGG